MNLQKCKECGGVVFTKDALKCKCSKCGKEYDLDYLELYQEHTDFTSKFGVEAQGLFNTMKSTELAILIGAFIIQYALSNEEEQFYASYEIELSLACFASEVIKSNSEDFEDYPYDTNCTNKLSNVISNCCNIIYAVCKKNDGKISYEWIMGYISNVVLGIVNKPLNRTSDNWKRYSHEEDSDGWQEYIQVLCNCQKVLDQLDKNGNVCLGFVYETLIAIEKKGINLTYVHRYWLVNDYATQYVGLAADSKAIWEKRLENYEKKLEEFNNIKNELEEKRIKEEEARLEAEKQARIEKFWSRNEDLKNMLLTEKNECLSKIKNLEVKMDNISNDKKICELKEEIQIANSILISLGFFDFKEKKARKLQIEQLNREILQQKDFIIKEKEKLQKEIDSIKNRINEIENEFIVDRP